MHTQKARGIKQLESLRHLFYNLGSIYNTVVRADQVLEWPDYVADQATALGNPVFIRPCPSRPRHGFVESERLAGGMTTAQVERRRKALKRIAQAAVDADPDAELVIMPFINAKASAIVTSANITLGPGHDGATSGRDSVLLPLPTPDLLHASMAHSPNPEELGVEEGEDIYYEFLLQTGHASSYVVQARTGPKLNGSADYVPEDTVVTQVVTPNTDNLLEWEHTVTEFPTGTVVHHPGGSLASHFGVHCVINRIPYLTGPEAPEVGSTIKATKGEPWGETEMERLAQAIRAYEVIDFPSHENLGHGVRMTLAGLHGLGHLMQSRHPTTIRAAAASIAMAIKLFGAICLGEARHFGRHKKEQYALRTRATSHGLRFPHMEDARHEVYVEATGYTYEKLVEWLAASEYAFSCAWWESGYGGKKWLVINRATLRFIEDVRQFLMAPTHGNMTRMLNTFNKIITLAHNGGFWLNKLIDHGHANAISQRPVIGFLTPLAYELLTMPLKARKLNIPDVRATVLNTRQRAEGRIDNGQEEQASEGPVNNTSEEVHAPAALPH